LKLTFWIGSGQLTMVASHTWQEIVQSRTTPRGGASKSDDMTTTLWLAMDHDS
jgi:hypothetical protein